MEFLKLLPPKGDALSVADVIRRLEDEFSVVYAAPDAGQDHVAGMIASMLQFSDTVPSKQERLAWLQSVQEAAVMVSSGDDLGLVASSCVMPDSELFFGSVDEVDGLARPLVERTAAALGYKVY